ncbi:MULTISPECIES: DUF1206 domain-containing protein [unclassified Microcella]|uniref:DUF1206 domain-containing protein n=1 Tax=unclassified Microcella TaxID=2630066 RepID=UPI0006F5FA8C|nr:MULTISPECIES: DUF1206 domain-containing protein [unclassified Microcella]KQV25082.1 hypothetical protein ASC54_11520 [Yonghaparkia sp. Root332]KRF31367.1 hypothetical protein ASG83_11325 [Yonghaparkia sp. Soil809]
MTSRTEGGVVRPHGVAIPTRTYRVVTRTGLAVNGVLHVLLGVIALSIPIAVLITPDSERVGALRAVAANPGGAVLFWVIAIGYVILGAWMLAAPFLERHRDLPPRDRAVRIGRGVAYLLLGVSSGSIAATGRSNPQEEPGALAASVVQLPLGPVVLIIIALLTLTVATYFGLKGWRRGFLDDIRLPAKSSGRRPMLLAGRVAYLGKAVALGVLGVLTLGAAFVPAGPAGVDGLLAALALSPAGPLLLAVVGLGLIAHGFYTAARARLARL